MQLLKNCCVAGWILLLLSPFTSCTNNEVTVETCIGETASFKWDYKVPPFYAVEWYFGKTPIAETLEEHLSQDFLGINDNYKSRFVLLEKDTVGFNLTNVNRDDDGDYMCILILQSTNVPVEKKGTLNVTGYHGTKIQSDEGEQPPESGEEKRRPVSDSPGTDNPAVVVPVVIAVIAAIAVVVAFVVIRKKRKSTSENQYVRSEEKPVSESHELLEQEIKLPDQQR